MILHRDLIAFSHFFQHFSVSFKQCHPFLLGHVGQGFDLVAVGSQEGELAHSLGALLQALPGGALGGDVALDDNGGEVVLADAGVSTRTAI